MSTDLKATMAGTLTPYLVVRGAAAAIDFYVRGLGAVEVFGAEEPGGRIAHAELTLGDGGASLMLADEDPAREIFAPAATGSPPVHLLLCVGDVDELVDRAVAAGATVVQPVADQPYGARMGGIKDPSGHLWYISTPFAKPA